jgi:hypothetical protein
VLATAATLSACGGASPSGVAVRVGASTIGTGAVAREIAALALEGVAPVPPRYSACIAHLEQSQPGSIASVVEQECAQQYAALHTQALEALILARWLSGQAGAQRLRPAGGESPGQLPERLAQAVGVHEQAIGEAGIASYYAANPRRYEHPEQRYINIVEHLHSEAEARRVEHRFTPGASMESAGVHEVFAKLPASEIVPRKRAILKAIFAAAPHTLVGPLPLNDLWCFFEVSRVIPRTVEPLAQVHDEIAAQLTGERRQRALARAVAAWRRKWRARTHCSPGYVVQKCSEYRGARAPEAPLVFN